MKLLLVEDDQSLGQLLKEGLTYEGFQVDWVKDGYTAIKKAMEEDYQIVILDIMLPKMDGLKVCKKLREYKDIPILMLTAKGQVEDKVEGLSAGADDYITKPFSFKELVARIRAVLRRYKKEDIKLIKVGDLEIRLNSLEVYYKGEKIHTTNKEFNLLKLLAEKAGTVVSREEIYSRVWGYSNEEASNIVDVYIKNLRTKLGDKDHKLIKTIRGYGYILSLEDVGKD